VLGIAPSATLPQLQVNQPDTAYTADQNHQLALMMQQQQQQQGLKAGSSSIALNRAASSSASIGGSSQAAATVTSTGPGDDQQQEVNSSDAAAADAAPSSSSGMAAQPSPKQQQLVSPTAMPMPRMSNAFARKHGLDPKENPLVNLQRLAMQQGNPSAQGMVRFICYYCYIMLLFIFFERATCRWSLIALPVTAVCPQCKEGILWLKHWL